MLFCISQIVQSLMQLLLQTYRLSVIMLLMLGIHIGSLIAIKAHNFIVKKVRAHRIGSVTQHATIEIWVILNVATIILRRRKWPLICDALL